MLDYRFFIVTNGIGTKIERMVSNSENRFVFFFNENALLQDCKNRTLEFELFLGNLQIESYTYKSNHTHKSLICSYC